jgi:DNA anti-recombination protein RmuC
MAVTDTIKDAAYVTIGVGVLGFQKAQVRRQELLAQLKDQRGTIEAQLADGRRSLESLVAQLDELVAPVRSQVEAGLDTVEATLPASVQDAIKQARTALQDQERAVRSRLGLDSAA